MEQIYIFGHQKPDTDSVCAAITFSYLKNKLGLNTVPKVLGHINNEAKYALDYFNVKEPGYLNDVKVQVKNMNYNKEAIINENASILDAFNLMQKEQMTAVATVDEKKKFKAIVTLKEIAKNLINGESNFVDSSLENIVKSIDGKIINGVDEKIKGRILCSSYQSDAFNEIVLTHNDILIAGNRYKILNHAIKSKVKLIILVGDAEISKEQLDEAIQNKINIIATNLDTFKTASKILLASSLKTIGLKDDPITILNTSYRSDLLDTIDKNGHTNYPVITKTGECQGVISINDVNNYTKLKVMLVDHNGFSQSVEGIEEAVIEEVVDHHNLLNIGTPNPINFRSMPVGCTCTLIYNMYKENNIPVPKDMAGLMLSAILSDTLLLKSVTTTKMDIETVKELEKIAEVNYQEYGHNMIKEGFSIKGKKLSTLLEEDIKTFGVSDKKVGISQIFTMDYDDIKDDIDNFINDIDNLASGKYDIVISLITDVEKNGSYVFYDRKSEKLLKDVFNDEGFKEGTYIQDLLSRKKQLVPPVMEILEKRA